MCRRGPLTVADDGQSGAVNDEVQAGARAGAPKREGEMLTASRERGVIGCREIDAQHPEDRGQDALGLTQRSVEDETERQGGFDGEIGILELPAPPADASRCPRGDRVGREPEGDVASPHEGSVVLGPVPDAIRCRVLRMHSRLHIEIMTRRRSRWSTCRPLLAHRAESAHQRRDRVSRTRVRRLMRLLGVHALYPRPRTSQPHPAHRISPSLLRDLPITRPNHVWCTDVTDIPLRRGFLCLVAVMDWASRTGLSWRLSNTLAASFCVEAVHEALERDGPPEIFNSDQGSPCTSVDFTDVLTEAGIRISMDGKGRWMDNVFIERLWRSLKYECVYLSEFATGSQARTGIGGWMDCYDRCRPHSSLNDRTPDEAYTNDGADTSPGRRPVSCQPHVA